MSEYRLRDHSYYAKHFTRVRRYHLQDRPRPYSLRSADRFACSNHISKGACSNSHTIPRGELEARVLCGLKGRMMTPEIVEEAMRAYAEETNRLNRERRSSGDAW